MKDSKNQKKFSLSKVFGTWTPPKYLVALFAGIKNVFSKIFAFYKKHIRVFAPSTIVFAVLIFGFLACGFWKSKQPQFLETECTVYAPVPRKDYDDEPFSILSLSFDASVVKPGQENQAIEDGVEISPKISGSWVWIGDSTIVFSPNEEWAVDQSYKVEFGKDFFPDHVKAPKSVSFETESFVVSIEDFEFYIDPQNPNVKRVLARIDANWPIDKSKLEQRIEIKPQIRAKSGTLLAKEYKANISYSKDALNAYIVSEPLGTPVDTEDIKITLKKGLTSSLGGSGFNSDIFEVTQIPGLTGFMEVTSIRNINVKTEDEEYQRVFVVSANGSASEKEIKSKVKAWILPVDRPDLPGIKGEKNTRWHNIGFVTKEVLEISTPINLELLPSQLDYNKEYSFAYNAPVGRYVYVVAEHGLTFYGGYRQKDNRHNLFNVSAFPREVKISSEGTIVPLTGSKMLALYSRGVPNIKMEIGRIKPEEINHLVSQSNGDLKNFRFTNYRFNENNISEFFSETVSLRTGDTGRATWFSFDFSKYLNHIPSKKLRYGIFMFSARGADSSYSYIQDKRLIIVTDLGVYVKKNSDKSSDVFVQSIGSGNPVVGATVSVIGLNGSVVAQTTTNVFGKASFPDLSRLYNEKQPTAYLVNYGEDLSFIPYTGQGRNLDWSNFDTGGIYGTSQPDSIRFYTFSDRGIYRPGDKMNIGIIGKANNWSKLEENRIMMYKIFNPNRAEVFYTETRLDGSGFDSFEWETKPTDPTGIYTINVYSKLDKPKAHDIFYTSHTVKVEEFLPDTLTINSTLLPALDSGWIKPQNVLANVSLRNLFGSPASDNDVSATIMLSPSVQYFPKWKDYTFVDPFTEGKSWSESLGSKKTDSNGNCSFEIDTAKFEKATYRLFFTAEGFEKGSGRSVLTQSTLFVSPLDYLVGYKADGDLSYITLDAKRNISLIAIGPDAKPKSQTVKASISESTYVSMLVQQPNGQYKYQSVKKQIPIEEFTIDIDKSGTKWQIPNRQGDFELKIYDDDDLVYARVAWSVVGSQNIQRSLDRIAELDIKTNKTDFKNGETIEIFLRAPYEGSGLITIERDKVYAHKWFKSNTTSSIQTIQVPNNLEGNAYLTVTWSRSIKSKEVFMSPLCYASVPFSISKESRTNKIELDVPLEIRPGDVLDIGYSCTDKGKIVVFAVDEGILQVANYKTPDPLSYFFQKRALEVNTMQLLDLVLPDYLILRTAGAVGGGMADDFLSKNLNPFKRKEDEPVVYWSGVIDVDSTKRTVSYVVPDYFNGSIRVMAVAVSDETIGVSETSLLVKAPYIINANLPTVASPSDEFIATFTVTNNNKTKENSKISISTKTNEGLEVVGNSNFDVNLDYGKDKTFSVKLRAKNFSGNGEFSVIASGEGETIVSKSNLSIRPAVPYRTTLISGLAKSSKTKINVERFVQDEFAIRDISLSYLPVGIAKGLWFYLDTYPYSCTEQLTSAAWPNLYPNLVKELDVKFSDASEKINNTIGILQSRQRYDGRFGFWTASSPAFPFISNYCTLFLTEAKANGYFVSDSFFDKCLDGVLSIAKSKETSEEALIDRAFACYVLSRNSKFTSSYLEALKTDLKENKIASEGLASLFIAGASAIHRQDTEAAKYLAQAKSSSKDSNLIWFSNPLSYKAIYLDIVARHFPQKLKSISSDLLESIAEDLSGQNYASLSANYALMAIESYLKHMPKEAEENFIVTETIDKKETNVLSMSGNILFSAKHSKDAKELEIANSSKEKLFYQLTTSGFDTSIPKKEIKKGIEIAREFTDERGNKITNFKVGQTVFVKVSIRTTGGNPVHNIAVVDLLPCGFEVNINSVREPATKTTWTPDYIDIREDRLVFYGTATGELKSFIYAVKAINEGSFTVPPLFAEALYNRSITAWKPQPKISISGR